MTKSDDLPGWKKSPLRLDVRTPAKAAREGLSGARIVAEVPLGLLCSGIAHLPGGAILALHDDSGVCEVRPGEKPRLLFDIDDGEGIAADPAGRHVYVVEERKRRVRKLEVRRDGKDRLALRDTGEDRRLPKLKASDNTGWEGLAFLPAKRIGGKHDHLACVHEGSPRRIGVYVLPDLDEGLTLKLPKTAKEALPDLSDVALEPATGHLFVVSDRSRTIVEFAFSHGKGAASGLIGNVKLEALAVIPLPLSKRRKPEALAFDGAGRLWVGLDEEDDTREDGEALVLELTRPRPTGRAGKSGRRQSASP
ncbi:MAG: SdiA-regulated domain-containing protein [Planctomycetes bacterium]|jgi:hypothetical protein|nr:SdiA-regulated domain-containing protein [Planctomycetota bacterium]